MSLKKVSGGVVHNIPSDFKNKLVSNTKAYEAWESLTPLSRNEWICWVISVKKEETRKEHIERAVSDLTKGKRRPCCWYGCIHRTDKEISPSVKNLVVDKQKKK